MIAINNVCISITIAKGLRGGLVKSNAQHAGIAVNMLHDKYTFQPSLIFSARQYALSGLQASVIEVPAECVGSYGSTGSGAECGIYSVMSIVFDMIRNICDGHLLFDSTRTSPCANPVSCYQPL